MLSKKIAILASVLVAVTLACQAATNYVPGTPTLDLGPQETTTAKAQSMLDEQATTSASANETAEALSMMETQVAATNEAQATSEARLSATAAQETEQALSAETTATQEQAIKLTATAEIEQLATAQAQSMFDQLQILSQDGVLLATEGEYIQLEDFDESWAQLNWYKWWSTGYSPARYAVKADTQWSSASDKANWFSSGCGFVFGEKDKDNHHLIYLGLDGYVYLARIQKGQFRTLAQKYYGKLSTPDGGADILMVVLDNQVLYYVNGTQVLKLTDNTLEPGVLNLTLLSGTNKDYGTRCEMTDIGLWIFK